MEILITSSEPGPDQSETSYRITRDQLIRVIHPNVAYFLTALDVKNLAKAFTIEWMRQVFPDAVWKRFVYLRIYDHDITLFPPSPDMLPRSWLAYILLSRRWEFKVEILEQTLLGYNFVFDENRKLMQLAFNCNRASINGFPDFDIYGHRILCSSKFHGLDRSSSSPFYASYASFALRSVLLDGLGKRRLQSSTSCISNNGGEHAIIVGQGVNWRPLVVRWIDEKPNAAMLVVIRKLGPSLYNIEIILARVAI